MYNENKVEQVISAINENGLNSMDDENLARLLSILSPKELEKLEQTSFEKLGGLEAQMRIMRIKPMTEVIIKRDLYRIRTSSIFGYFMESLKNQQYRSFIESLTDEELADLKKYIYFTTDEKDKLLQSASEKLIKIFTREMTHRDTNRKPYFSS